MVVAFGGIFLLIYIMFESFGITEYVWPILFPILGWTFGIMFFILLIVGIAFRVGGGIPSDTEIVRHTYEQPIYHTGDYSSGSIYTVPMYCPHCKYKIELNHVEWIGSSELTCSNCFRTIQAGIRESF